MKQLLWYTAFFTLLFAGDRLGGHLLKRQVAQSQFRYSRLYGGQAAADILLVGNSRGLTFYQPYIEEKTGHSTFNFSYNGLPMDAAKVLVQDYLDRYPTPQLLVVDITSCDRTNDALLAGFSAYADQSFRLDTLIHSRLPKVWWGNKVSSLFRYNSEIFQRALSYRRQTDQNWLLDRVISPRLVAHMEQDSYLLKVHPYLVAQLQEMVASAQAKGVSVRLVISPYFPGFDHHVTHLDALKKAVEQATGLPVQDYRQALSDPDCFGDFMHPNKKGSMAYIDLMRRDGVLP